MSHALVVGGTGMLRGVSLELAKTWDCVSVIARTPHRLEELRRAAEDMGRRIHGMVVSWSDEGRLARELSNACERSGPITLAVCWIHSSASGAPGVVARTLAEAGVRYRYFHIYGSEADAMQPVKQRWHLELPRLPLIEYRRIRLGRKLARGGLRWLTDEEICQGVLAAIDGDLHDSLAGDRW